MHSSPIMHRRYLTHLNLEDVFLASDEAFWYSGGTVAGNELMFGTHITITLPNLT